MKTEIKNWSQMDAAAVANVRAEDIAIDPSFVDGILNFEPCGQWAQEPRLSFYWAAAKVAHDMKGSKKFAPEMYETPADYRNTSDSNEQGEP